MNKIEQSFKIKDELNPEFWNSDLSLKPDVRINLIKIANEFIKFLNVKIEIKDIILTGSISNYNWSTYSDVDLHIIFDFSQIDGDSEFVKEYFYDKKLLWGDIHDIKALGYDVELYAQDSNEKFIAGGIFSIIKNKWITKPSREKMKVDIETSIKKANFIKKKIESALKDKNCSVECLQKLREKIWKFRQCGLDKDGETSVENIAFKILRRDGTIEKLKKASIDRLDKELTFESFL
jgi:predicted nucleotidyltransferase